MIRLATAADASGICRLLTQLEYPGTEAFLGANLEAMLPDPRELLLVWSEPGSNGSSDPTMPPGRSITGFLSADFSIYPQLKGRIALIKALAVDEGARSQGIGRLLEAELTRRARAKGCVAVIVHCHTRRTRAHEFYYRQGFEESPKYLIKRLM